MTPLDAIILDAAKAKRLDDAAFNEIKRKHSRGQKFPTNIALFSVYQKLLEKKKIARNPKLEQMIRKRKVRTLSGIAAITVLTPNGACPGNCIFCPTERGMPKSYLSNEPAVMRAIANNFDPYLQVRRRLEALAAQGHVTDKIEIIVIGGTWSSIPHSFQEWYIGRLYEALNDKTTTVPSKPRASLKKSLRALQDYNRRRARHKLVGLTLETRPDWITEDEIRRMRMYGCTRVELGVQSVYDDVLDASRRGHRIDTTARATALLKDAGFKINYHIMPNLPKATPKRDMDMARILFSDPRFQPDMLKIYPCIVVKNADLYAEWKKGKFKPYTDKQLITVIKTMKSYVPEYCRIVRIIRDIPAPSIEAGSTASNLRQTIHEKMKREGVTCRCIRCREIKDGKTHGRLTLRRTDYEASGGKEIFLSFNDAHDKLVALLRLRIPPPSSLRSSLKPLGFNISATGKHHVFPAPLLANAYAFATHPPLFPALKNAALIREVHTYGEVASLTKTREEGKKQHKGLGKKLLKEAEKIAKKEFKLKKIAVISGIGVRGYYAKNGYTLRDTYMVKAL